MNPNLASSTENLRLHTAATPCEIALLRAALNEEHYLGAGRPAGRTLWQGVYEELEDDGGSVLVAALCWGGAAPRLKERDRLIEWDTVTRANRLGLMVGLRRFLILDSRRRPNLASQCLGLSLRSLQKEWENRYGYRPLLAESFHDPKEHTGTLYQVTNWKPLGLTKGFKRHKADFYQDAKTPKHLWVMPLQKNAISLLGRPGTLPPEQRAGIDEAACGAARSALPCKDLRTLYQALREVPDPRSPKSRRHPLGAMLALVVLGLLCGARDVKAIRTRCGPPDQRQRRAIGLKRRDKNGRLTLPGYDALNDIVNAVDPVALARVLNQWLTNNSENLPKSLAIDGKDLGGGSLGELVSLCHHATGAPLAMRTYSGAKDDCEQPEARRLLAEECAGKLENAVITADALHCQKKRR